MIFSDHSLKWSKLHVSLSWTSVGRSLWEIFPSKETIFCCKLSFWRVSLQYKRVDFNWVQKIEFAYKNQSFYFGLNINITCLSFHICNFIFLKSLKCQWIFSKSSFLHFTRRSGMSVWKIAGTVWSSVKNFNT